MKKLLPLFFLIISHVLSAQVDQNTAFITTWEVPENGSITINADERYAYNYDIKWEKINDPTQQGSQSNIRTDFVIKELSAGKYRVLISGTFPLFKAIGFYQDTNGQLLRTVEQWGTQVWQSMNRSFEGATNLSYIGKDNPNLSQVTDMSYMFLGATSFNGDLSKWDVSNITNMVGMFQSAVTFNGDLSKWNVSNVTTMEQMFYFAYSFNGDLNKWNVSNVTNMSAMFGNATLFNRSLHSWDLSSVDSERLGMYYMFSYSGMSVANYDSTLIGWANSSTTPNGISLNADGLKYCEATQAREKLINSKEWKIQGDHKLGIEYKLNDKAVRYDGMPHIITLNQEPSPLESVNYKIYDSSNMEVQEAINAGVYIVEAIISGCGPDQIKKATLTITPAILKVSADAHSKVYGSEDPVLTYTVKGLLNDDALTGSLSREEGENVGIYTINQGDLKASNNYTLTYVSSDLTITSAPVTGVTLSDANHIYDGKQKELLISGTLPSGTVVSYTNN
ncbi:BspA family leucine-rich repeat surface protein, partial [Myroides pelagicus]|uniref:BspA family leucine-rich repeat surface protein n=1 Tax=Myroides pelagicus TaxID=270914 RepID=UPI002DB8FD65